MDRTSIITIGVLFGIIVLVGVYAWFVSSPAQSDDVTQSAAEQNLIASEGAAFTDLDGEMIDLAQYDGSIRVVNSWASWCPFCVAELADFSAVANEYADQGVVVIAINRKEPASTVRSFLQTVSDVSGIVFVQDPADDFYTRIGGFTMPETIFYDREGNIVLHKRGFMALAEMRTHIETALAASQ